MGQNRAKTGSEPGQSRDQNGPGPEAGRVRARVKKRRQNGPRPEARRVKTGSEPGGSEVGQSRKQNRPEAEAERV